MVFSDHGFTSFRRGVHINSWLVQNGFMTLTKKMSIDDKEGGGLFQYVDWKKTSAYALGFGSIYLNLRGRERQGTVEPGSEAESLSDRIISEMAKLTDPKDGQAVVKKVYKRHEIYDGGQEKNAPDLVMGFNDGFRGSWQTALGGSPAGILEDNLKKWSGDHIVDPSIVPGIFLANFKIKNDAPSLMDIAPTVLSFFGLDSNNMKGQSLI
jgi:predicted AlkP superfamily phosphohydrolase/phosphomutase